MTRVMGQRKVWQLNMEQKETFKMTYSAQQQEEIQSIRKKYLPPEESKMEQLRALDAQVNRRAARNSIGVGVLGTLLLGAGMSLCMTELGDIFGSAGFFLGVGVGVVGLITLACAYPLHEQTLKKEREKAAPDILRLTDELMQ